MAADQINDRPNTSVGLASLIMWRSDRNFDFQDWLLLYNYVDYNVRPSCAFYVSHPTEVNLTLF